MSFWYFIRIKTLTIIIAFMNNYKQIQLCFYCEYYIMENDRLSISSITHAGLKYNITCRHRKKMDIIDDVTLYEPNLIHLHCYDKIASELGFGNGQY
jgi:hypothetical protein